MTTVAWIGLGAMGSRMATRLRDAGYELVVWNRTREKAEALGTAIADSPRQAAERAEFVFTMVADPAALAAVTAGEEGLLAGLREGSVLLDMSTVGPQAVSQLSEQMPDHASLLDVPVLGSLPQAESGTLTLFAGGDDASFERASPLLEVLGEPLRTGPLGSGAAAKLVANATLVGTVTLLGETLALAAALGLPRETAWEVLAATPLAAQAERRRPPSRRASIRPVFVSPSAARTPSSCSRRPRRRAATCRSWRPPAPTSPPPKQRGSALRITPPSSGTSAADPL